jgi:hypothetical protein
MKSCILSFLFGCCCFSVFALPPDEKFVSPDEPLVKHAAPNESVENGTTFESGTIRLSENSTLVLPESAVVEEYSGSTIRFFLTKSLRFAGHPPHLMPTQKWREYLGIALQKTADANIVSTYGEWGNKGGSARVRLLVMFPKGIKIEHQNGLDGENSQASKEMDVGNPAMTECYWYSGIEPKDGWEPIETELNYNRFLAAQ